MENINRLFAAAGIAIFSSTAQSIEIPSEVGSDRAALLLNVVIDANYAYFTIANATTNNVDIAYPFLLSVGKSIGGLELVFREKDDRDGEVKRLCAMIDWTPEFFPSKYSLLPSGVVGFRFELEDLRKYYCLDHGTYEMTANYYNVVEAKDLGNEPAPVVATLKL